MQPVTPPGHRPEVWAPLLADTDLLDPEQVLTAVAARGAAQELVVVSAHPDDETIGAGRFVSWWARSGRPVHSVILTAGEACIDHVASRPAGLAERRLSEWSDALDRLGAAGSRTVVGVPDGNVADAVAAAEEAVLGAARRAGAVAVVLAPWTGDPHPDHRAAGRAAARAARALGVALLQYPVWMQHWSDPSALQATGDRLVRVATDDADETARTAALACFESQLHPLHADLGPVVPADMLKHHARQLLLLPATSRPLNATCPAPAPYSLPTDYDRHTPTPDATNAAMRHLIAAQPWRELDWPDLARALVALGRTDIPLSRLVEGHIDAVRILDQAGSDTVDGATYGVWASRSRGTGVRAIPLEAPASGWALDGTLRFASGVGVLDRALVPVWPADDVHLLVDVPVSDWAGDESAWKTGAMSVSRSFPTQLDSREVTPAAVRGDPNFYLTRPGFHAGGLGVAAVWAGGAARILDLVLDNHHADAPPSPTRAVRLGRMRVDLGAMLATLESGAAHLQRALDRSDTDTIAALAAEARGAVASATLRLLDDAKALVGPAGLGYDAAVSHAIADLDLYVRQFNPDGELGRLAGELT